jgi:16S rRNA (adenine1518-N6/adenine1519-N6)-dimethyltransferase
LSAEDSNSAAHARKLLRQSGLKAKKRLGQNFLTDRNVLRKILNAAELINDDVVVEVGPGLGVLTSALASNVKKVFAIELDTELSALLKDKFIAHTNVDIINADILKVDLLRLLGEGSQFKVVANLPYYITSPVLRYFMENRLQPSLMVVMVQKEVAEAIVARSGKMSLLAVSLHMYSKPKIIARVPARCFHPRPKVDSAIVRFDVLPQPAVRVDDIDAFFDVVKRGFSTPRKQLRNSLANGYKVKPADVDHYFQGAGIDPRKRAETLRLEEWERLYQVIKSTMDLN